MNEGARIKITWTTSTNAASYKIYRSENSNGPWVLKTTVAPYIGTWYDNDVDPSPFTTYYYQIVTTCTNGSTSTQTANAQCKNCPVNNRPTIFGLRQTVYSPQGGVQVDYYDALNEFLNNNYNSNKTIIQPAFARKYSSALDSRKLFCHKCGKDITGSSPNSSTAEVSYQSNQRSMVSQLPTSPTQFGGSANNNLGTFTQKKKQSYAPLAPTGTQFDLGIGSTDNGQMSFSGYSGSFVYNNASGGAYNWVNYNGAAQNYSSAGAPVSNSSGSFQGYYIPWKSIRIGKMGAPTGQPQTYTDFSAGLSLIPSGTTWNNTSWYVALYDPGFGLHNATKCLVYLYKIRRQPLYDNYNSNSVLINYGFELNAVENNFFVTDGNIRWYLDINIPWQTGDFLPYNRDALYGGDQNLYYLKFFQV